MTTLDLMQSIYPNLFKKSNKIQVSIEKLLSRLATSSCVAVLSDPERIKVLQKFREIILNNSPPPVDPNSIPVDIQQPFFILKKV